MYSLPHFSFASPMLIRLRRSATLPPQTAHSRPKLATPPCATPFRLGPSGLLLMCNWGADAVYTWGLKTGNNWRHLFDVTDSWSSIANIAAANSGLVAYAGPGGFNDSDMLEIGNGGLTAAEERTRFGLWAIAKRPLLIGTDLTKISNASLAVLLNAVRTLFIGILNLWGLKS